MSKYKELSDTRQKITKPIHVMMAAPEIAPLVKTGGLADVLGSLPAALQNLGVRVTMVMPAYRSVLEKVASEDTCIRFNVKISDRNEQAIVLKTSLEGGIPVYLIKADKYFDRENLYTDKGSDYSDNAERFAFFSRAVLEMAKLDPPAILHCHDWQSALAIVFLKAQRLLYPQLTKTKTVLTVHNLGYHGLFWHLDWHLLNLGWRFYKPAYLEYWDKINFLKGGLVFADAITTVSPSYAKEIITPENGNGLDGVVRERSDKLIGILNGADYKIWGPKNDPFLYRNYFPSKMDGKKVCKARLQRKLRLTENPDVPVICMVSRLAEQKGFDLLEEAAEELLERDIELVVLGTGERHYELLLKKMAKRYPGKVAVRFTFSEQLAHKFISGADMLLMPSRYEPGGLIQIYAMRYGTIPIVRATGGLKDTVKDFTSEPKEATGFAFEHYKASELIHAVDRALAAFRRKPTWTKLMKNAMAADFSWDESARKYTELYRKLVSK